MKFPYKLVDLTHVLESTMPAWDGGCGFNHDVQMDYPDCQGEDKFRVMKLSMDAGIGTHMDAPSHYIAGGKCIHEFAVNDLCMPCVVIDVSSKAHEHYRVSARDISDFESLHGPISQDACVMIKTGWERFWNEPLKYHNNHVFPSISIEAADLLLERGVAALGIDTLSPDCPEYGFKVHQAFLGKGKILIENVANLDNIPATGAFLIICPLKVRDGTEAPVRLLGLLS
jgi:kynurenine formamidase